MIPVRKASDATIGAGDIKLKSNARRFAYCDMTAYARRMYSQTAKGHMIIDIQVDTYSEDDS